jgi:hypothetical protein
MATRKIAYGTAVTGTGGVTSLASSSTWTAGYEWYLIDNSTDLAIDRFQSGQITVGTTPTANTEIRLYTVASYDGSTWPNVFDGTPSAETVTSEGVRDSFCRLAAVLRVDAATSNVAYPYQFTISQLYGGNTPKKCVVFVAHNCSAALNGTGGNHTYSDTPITETIA